MLFCDNLLPTFHRKHYVNLDLKVLDHYQLQSYLQLHAKPTVITEEIHTF